MIGQRRTPSVDQYPGQQMLFMLSMTKPLSFAGVLVSEVKVPR